LLVSGSFKHYNFSPKITPMGGEYFFIAWRGWNGEETRVVGRILYLSYLGNITATESTNEYGSKEIWSTVWSILFMVVLIISFIFVTICCVAGFLLLFYFVLSRTRGKKRLKQKNRNIQYEEL
jgi:predicted membrane protein